MTRLSSRVLATASSLTAAALEVKVGTFDVLLLRPLRAFRADWLDSAPPERAVPTSDGAPSLADEGSA